MTDWHPEDIKANVRKRGATLASIGMAAGVPRQVMGYVLARPHAAAERAIADYLGVPAHIIWPSRYHADGQRRSPQPGSNYNPAPRFPRIARGSDLEARAA